MTSNRPPIVSAMTTRQKITIVAFVIVIIIVLWQSYKLLRGDHAVPPVATPTARPAGAPMTGNVGQPMSPMAPRPATLPVAAPKPATPPTPQELALIQLQQATQAKYLAALNELQMLKVSRDIAETNQAIANAKLATVTSEKKIVDLLSPSPIPQPYARGLINPAPATPPVTAPPTQVQSANYTVVSVSQLQYRWTAVLGFQGNLYSVRVGDVLPADGSTVTSIDRTGVWLRKDGASRKVSLVPLI